MSAKDALLKYHKKDWQKQKRAAQTKKPNGKPEKLLEAQVLEWASQKAISLHVIESKAVFSKAAGRYLRGQAEVGMPDLVGNCEGLSIWIELKARGRRSTLKPHQRIFLESKIQQGCFACCVDSVESLASVLAAFLSTPSFDRVQLLLRHLPKTGHQISTSLEEELF